jgi:DNA mismatch endonuclease (patch repair protein)
MPDVFSKSKRSTVMAKIRSHGNKSTELKLASILRAQGISGWRRNQSLIGRPDFVFPRERVAIFVDGCFWHGCRWHGRKPGSNQEYWDAKLERNRRRDRLVTRALRALGWRVIRIWEHELGSPRLLAKLQRAFFHPDFICHAPPRTG